MIVGYKHYLSFLIDSLQKDYKNISYVVDDLVFDFKQYVFSQMHLGVWCHYYGRSLYTIYDVYRWLDYGVPVDPKSLHQVLLWYYSDLALFIRGTSSQGYLSSVSLSLEVSLDLERVEVAFSEEKEKVLKCIHSEEPTEYSKYIDLTFEEITRLDTLFVSEISSDRFISSIIISKYAANNPGKIIVMGGVVECH